MTQQHNTPLIEGVRRGRKNNKKNKEETYEKMNNTTQNLILVILGIIALTTLIQGKDITITTTIIGILGGYLTGKTLTEKQEEMIQDATTRNRDEYTT